MRRKYSDEYDEEASDFYHALVASVTEEMIVAYHEDGGFRADYLPDPARVHAEVTKRMEQVQIEREELSI